MVVELGINPTLRCHLNQFSLILPEFVILQLYIISIITFSDFVSESSQPHGSNPYHFNYNRNKNLFESLKEPKKIKAREIIMAKSEDQTTASNTTKIIIPKDLPMRLLFMVVQVSLPVIMTILKI